MSFSVGDLDKFAFGYNSAATQANNEGDFFRWVNVTNSPGQLAPANYTTMVMAYNSSGQTGAGEISSVVYLNSSTTLATLTLDYATQTSTGTAELISVIKSTS